MQQFFVEHFLHTKSSSVIRRRFDEETSFVGSSLSVNKACKHLPSYFGEPNG